MVVRLMFDVYLGRGQADRLKREKIKGRTLQHPWLAGSPVIAITGRGARWKRPAQTSARLSLVDPFERGAPSWVESMDFSTS